MNRNREDQIKKRAPFYKTMFRWNRGVESPLWLPHSVIAGLNRDTIFFPRETIFSPMLFARCEGCCNLAPSPGEEHGARARSSESIGSLKCQGDYSSLRAVEKVGQERWRRSRRRDGGER